MKEKHPPKEKEMLLSKGKVDGRQGKWLSRTPQNFLIPAT
jgi:hypothetical protein